MNKIKENQNKFECVLGCHEYTIPDKDYPYIKICKHCRKYGYYRSSYGVEEWTKYNNNGNRINFKNSNGYEIWYEHDSRGNLIHIKDSEGYEKWLDKMNK